MNARDSRDSAGSGRRLPTSGRRSSTHRPRRRTASTS